MLATGRTRIVFFHKFGVERNSVAVETIAVQISPKLPLYRIDCYL
jgi:hypothetical protein